MYQKRPRDSDDEDEETPRDRKRRRRLEEARKTEMKDKVARGGGLLPHDCLLAGPSGLVIWRPSLCVHEDARAFIADHALAWKHEAPDATALYTRSFLLTDIHGLTRWQLKEVPECVRSRSRAELGLIDALPFAYFNVDEDRVIRVGLM
jgi:hypothetical protein